MINEVSMPCNAIQEWQGNPVNRFYIMVALIEWRKLMPLLSYIKTMFGIKCVRFVSGIYFHTMQGVLVWEMKYRLARHNSFGLEIGTIPKVLLNNMSLTVSTLFACIKGKIAPSQKVIFLSRIFAKVARINKARSTSSLLGRKHYIRPSVDFSPLLFMIFNCLQIKQIVSVSLSDVYNYTG